MTSSAEVSPAGNDTGGGDPIRVAIVGAGRAGELHVAACGRLSHLFSLSAVVDPSERAARRIAPDIALARVATVEELIRSSRIDAAIVASPHAFHTSQVRALVEAGIPTLVEKPMATNPTDCADLGDLATARGCPLVAGYLQRYLPSVQAARDLLIDGAVGQLRQVVSNHASRYEPGTRPDWFLDESVGTGGIVTNIGSHAVDRVLALAQPAEVSVSYAWAARRGVIVDAAFALDLGDGRSAICTLTGTALPESEATHIIGTTGAISITPDAGVILYREGQPVCTRPPHPNEVDQAFDAQLIDFHAAVRGQAAVVDATYGVRVSQLLQQVQLLAMPTSKEGQVRNA